MGDAKPLRRLPTDGVGKAMRVRALGAVADERRARGATNLSESSRMGVSDQPDKDDDDVHVKATGLSKKRLALWVGATGRHPADCVEAECGLDPFYVPLSYLAADDEKASALGQLANLV